MEDRKLAEQKEKPIFRFFRFLFFELWSFFVTSSHQFLMNFHDNTKNINRKMDFSFVETHCAFSIKMGSKPQGGRGGLGSAYPQLGQGPTKKPCPNAICPSPKKRIILVSGYSTNVVHGTCKLSMRHSTDIEFLYGYNISFIAHGTQDIFNRHSTLTKKII